METSGPRTATLFVKSGAQGPLSAEKPSSLLDANIRILRERELLEELAEKALGLTQGPWAEYNRLDCIRLAIELGRVDLARSLVERSSTLTVRQQHTRVTGEALLAEATGDVEKAIGLYEDSERRWTEFGNEPERAHALLGKGRCLLERGRRRDARAAIEEASRIFVALGAKPFLEIAERLMKNLEA